MRAEVGLMTRHIVIDAEVSEGNSNGGHVKVVFILSTFILITTFVFGLGK